MKYYIITFGCAMNKSDSERIASALEKKGYRPASNMEKADLIAVNMCSVRRSAVDRVFGVSQKFLKLKAKNKKLKTVLTGCILKSDKKKLVDKFDLIEDKNKYLFSRPKYSNKNLIYIPISNGCNNFCTYCVVPYARGPLACRPHQEILKEVKKAVTMKTQEIWLLGQNVNDYLSEQKTKKVKQKINFAKLVKMVNDIPGNFKLFFISPNPKNFSDELINALKKCKKFSKHLNLPVQSGNDLILKKMNRPYTAKQYKELVGKIRKKIPDIRLSTDVIVGFPGETEKQFKDTVKLFKEIKFDSAYISKYSSRPGTVAFEMKDDVPLKEKKQREKILRDIINGKNKTKK